MNTIVINTPDELENFLTPLFEKFLEKLQSKPEQCNYLNDELLTKKEVLKITKYGNSWFYENIKNGNLPAIKVRGEYRVKYQDLQNFINTDD